MDTRNSALIVALYMLCVVIIGAACFAYYSYERSTNPPTAAVDLDTMAPQSTNRSPTIVYSAAVAKANKSVRDLQFSLAANRDLLDKQTAALHQKSAECKALREQLDHSFTLLLSLLNEDSNAASGTGDATPELRVTLDSELARLKQSFGTPKTSEDHEQQLLQLQAELMQADLHLEVVEQQSQRELELVMSEKRTVEQAASDLIARCGATAIPLLVDLLADERVEVRRWAAKALGVVGPEARDASGVLRELLTDPDPTVRTEVERALAKID